MKTQEDFLREIREIKTAHSEYDIHFFIPGEKLIDGLYSLHKIGSIKISPFCILDNEIYTDEKEIKQFMRWCMDGEEDIENLVDRWYEYTVKTAIIVYTQEEYLGDLK